MAELAVSYNPVTRRFTARDAPTQRIILGLGTMAVEAAADYAKLASPTFTTQITTPKIVATAAKLTIQPTTDAVTAIQLNDKDGNVILNIDTTNNRVGIGTVSPGVLLELYTAGDTALRTSTLNFATQFGQYEGVWQGLSNPFILQAIGTAHDIVLCSNSNLPGISLLSNGCVGIGKAVPVCPGGAAAHTLHLAASDYPQYIMEATSGGVNEKVWRLICRSSQNFQIQCLDDAGGTEITGMEMTRSGNSITAVQFPSGTFKITGAFGCNAATPRTKYGSGGAVTYTPGAKGMSTDPEFADFVSKVNNIRTALVNNGIMS